MSWEQTDRQLVTKAGAFCAVEGVKNFLVVAKKEISIFLLLQWYVYAAVEAV